MAAPLLLLPGMLCDDAFWAAQVRDLADVCAPRVIANEVLDSFEKMAARVLALAPERFALAGHSMGGRVALEVYRQAPERVTKLALLATDFRGVANADERAVEVAQRQAWLEIAREDGMEAFAKVWLKQVVAPDNLSDRSLVAAITAMTARQPIALLEAQTLAALVRADYAAMLPRIACPTLLCAGEADTWRPVSLHEEMAALIPASRLVVMAGSGHMLAMEQPEAVTNAMRQWLL
ncbi:MAG TPA: alpha/beta hydrolase [Rhizomicrobium sp.]|nr:alpha/beta hydrolase [Rhizomicrobium sp.]